MYFSCLEISKDIFHLVEGRIRPSLEKPSFEEIKHNNWDLSAGGSWRPRNCTSRHRVAIIIPFRDRYEHLRILLDNIHPILKRQQLDYSIYVIEQVKSCSCRH